MINNKKTKAMLINFTKNHQFTTRLELINKNIEVVPEMKILGTIISNSLSWNTNTSNLIQKVNKRMLLNKKILGFGASTEEMVHIWNMYCQSFMEQWAVVWSISLTPSSLYLSATILCSMLTEEDMDFMEHGTNVSSPPDKDGIINCPKQIRLTEMQAGLVCISVSQIR